MQERARIRHMPDRRRGSRLAHLRTWREWAGLSQAELAARAGVARVTVNQIETHPRGAKRQTVAGLAAALGVPPDVLTLAPGDPDAEAWAVSLALAFARERASAVATA